jgi:ribosome-binding factor A
MDTKKQKQVSELIRRHFSTVLQDEGPIIYGSKTLVSVTQVHMSPDLGLAKIYLSAFNHDEGDQPIQLLENELPKLRQALGARIRKFVRRIPDIVLFYDDTIDEMYRIDAMLEKVKIESPESSED